MYRAVLSEGQIHCERYEHVENGVELYDEDDGFIAFVPYTNLYAVADDERYSEDERSIM